MPEFMDKLSRSSLKSKNTNEQKHQAYRWIIANYLTIIFLFSCCQYTNSQSLFKGLENLFIQPKAYIANFTPVRPAIDGNIHDPAWQQASWTDYFVDIEGDKNPLPAMHTRAKMLWNDSCLFVAAEIQDPHVWATLKQRDDIIFHDNDFEIFIDPDNDTHQYFEIEVNALNTIFDLFLTKPYRNGAKAFISYDVTSLQSAVQVNGTLNNSSDKDSGWTVEMAIPFRSVILGNSWKAPEEGTLWRINFSRVQWDTEIVDNKYIKSKSELGKALTEHNWVWSPQGLIDMHYPERWGYLQFTRTFNNDAIFRFPYIEKQKQYLWLIYYRQKKYFSSHRNYAKSLGELDINEAMIKIESKNNEINMEATGHQFTAYIFDQANRWSINDEGLIQKVKQVPQ